MGDQPTFGPREGVRADGPSLGALANALQRRDLAAATTALDIAVRHDEMAREWVDRGRYSRQAVQA